MSIEEKASPARFGGDVSDRAARRAQPARATAPTRRRKRRGPGRNLPAAIAVGCALGGAVLASLYLAPATFVGLASVAVVLGIWELGHALAHRDVELATLPLSVGSVATLVAAYAGGVEPMLIGLTATVFAGIAWRARFGEIGYLRDISAGTLATVYVPLLIGFAMLLLRSPHGNARVVVFILAVVASDVGGFAAGVIFGRHPMAPTISPRKSWEGFAGSVILSAAVTGYAMPALLDGPLWLGIVLGLASAVSATGGDLAESLLKRDLGIKDMGSLLPGHGGIMDRLDSLLPTAPIAYLLMAHFLSS